MFISLDLETTGFDPKNNQIIEFGAIKFDLEGNQETLQFLINPQTPIPQIVTYITNISDEDVQEAPIFQEKAQEIQDFIGDLPIVGHNIQFDTGFLKANNIPLTNPEYDTCQLASILTPGLPSYSLEVLSQILEIKHQEKHRALDDAIAAMELFIILSKEFQTLPADTIKEIHQLCEKTEWPLKNFLLQLNHTEEKAPKHTPLPETPFTKPTHFTKILDPQKTALFEEIPPFNELAKVLTQEIDKDSYIAVPHDLFRKVEQEIPDTFAKIDAPSKYLSLKRLQKFKEKEFFEHYEFSALLKYIIWSKKTKTGLLSELKMFSEERSTIAKIHITEPKDEPFFQKALQKDEGNAAICTHDYIITEKPQIKDLTILDFDKFISSIYFEHSKYLKEDFFLNTLKTLQEFEPENQTIHSLTSKSKAFFELVTSFHNTHNDRNSFAARAFLNNLNTDELKASISNLIETSKELGEINNEETYNYLQNWKKLLGDLHSTFFDKNNSMAWTEIDFNDNFIIRKVPISLKSELIEILSNCQNYKIINENFDLGPWDNAEFIRNLYGLDPDIPLHKDTKLNEDLQIFITEDVPHQEQNEVTLINSLTKFLEKKKGRTALMFNSKAKLKHFTLKLSEKLKPLGIEIISQLTGSIGKLKEKYKQNPENSILFITPNFWDKFEHQDLIDTLFIHKLPFDPPSDPYIVSMSTNYNNAFNEFQVPRAIFSLKKSINRLKSGTAILLDSRVVEKAYGKDFIAALNTQAKVENINLASLSKLPSN